jgi:membrane fusion protein (multidrug efflux system)
MSLAPRTLPAANLALLGLLLAVSACARPDAAATDATQATPKVVFRALALQEWSERLGVPATAVPPALVAVSAQVKGRVEALHADEGDEVALGALLAELDTTDLDLARRQAAGQVAMARAGLAAAEVTRQNVGRQLERYEGLKRANSVPDAEYDNVRAGALAAEAQVGVARAQVAVAEAALATVDEGLADARVVAPIAGLVVKRGLNVGDEAIPMSPQPVFVLASPDPLYVEGNAPERALGLLRPGMAARLTFDGLAGEAFEGTVKLVGPTVDPIAKTVRVRVEVPNPLVDGRRRLAPGLSGLIELVPSQGRYFVLPLNAVRRQEGEQLVVLLVGEGDKVVERRLTPLRRDGLTFLVSDGLTEGERLVLAAPKDLQAGAVVDARAE